MCQVYHEVRSGYELSWEKWWIITGRRADEHLNLARSSLWMRPVGTKGSNNQVRAMESSDLSVWQGKAPVAPLACDSVGANVTPLQIPKLPYMSSTRSLTPFEVPLSWGVRHLGDNKLYTECGDAVHEPCCKYVTVLCQTSHREACLTVALGNIWSDGECHTQDCFIVTNDHTKSGTACKASQT